MAKTSEEIRQGYRERLILPETPLEDEIIFYTKSGLEVAKKYERVVIGDRGPYIEFSENMITKTNIHIPDDQKWRLKNPVCFYNEWRTDDEYFVKIYEQKRLVKYADYKIKMWYISPFDLITNLYPKLVRKL